MDRPPRDKNESIAHFKMTRTISYGCDVSVSLVAEMLMQHRDFVVKQ